MTDRVEEQTFRWQRRFIFAATIVVIVGAIAAGLLL
jgi:hypothetical protein